MTPGKLPVVLPQSMKLCTPKRKNTSRTQSLMIYVMELNMSCYCRDESTVQSTVDDHPQIVSKLIYVEIEMIIVIIWNTPLKFHMFAPWNHGGFRRQSPFLLGFGHFSTKVQLAVMTWSGSVTVSHLVVYWKFILPSRELTYPTLGKGKSSSKCHFWGIC